MPTQYTARSSISALSAAQSAAIADATVKSATANERWLYSATATDGAADGLVIVPSDNPARGRWLRQADYSATVAIINGLSSGGGSSSSADVTRLQFKSWFEGA